MNSDEYHDYRIASYYAWQAMDSEIERFWFVYTSWGATREFYR